MLSKIISLPNWTVRICDFRELEVMQATNKEFATKHPVTYRVYKQCRRKTHYQNLGYLKQLPLLSNIVLQTCGSI